MAWLFASAVLLGLIPPASAQGPDGLFGITSQTDVLSLPYCRPAKHDFDFDCEIPDAAPLFPHAQINFDPDDGVCAMRLSVDLEKDAVRARLEEIVRRMDATFGREKAVRTRLSKLLSEHPDDWTNQIGSAVSLDTVDNAWRIESNAKLRKPWEAELQLTRRAEDKFHIELATYFHPYRYCYKPLPPHYTIREFAPGRLK